MTMKITIANDDDRRTARFEVEERNVHTGDIRRIQADSIAPGAKAELWIHAGRRVLISEDADARI